jgi:hypothetical protein
MWKELIGAASSDFTFSDPAAWASVSLAESSLNVAFPAELRELLLESDGVEGEYGLNLIWPVERIVADNLRFRQSESFQRLYMPFSHLLFFGDAGNGDQFAFRICANGRIERGDIFAWNHEDDSRTWVAPSLKEFFGWWAAGKIQL